jgi:hypothetical protein
MQQSARVALFIAGASVVAVFAITGKPNVVIAQALLVGLPLLLIVFPDAMESAFRSTFHGMTQGGDPTPGEFLAVLGWIALIAFAVGSPVLQILQRD